MGKRRSKSIRQPRADVERMGEALARPGLDTRAWVTMGRTEAGEDTRWFDAKSGWIVDVLTYGTTSNGVSVPCRVAAPFPGLDGYGCYRPPAQDEEVVLVMPGGFTDEDPIVLGVVSNGDGGTPPATVAGRTVTPSGTTSPGGSVSAEDCEFAKSPYSSVAEWEGEYHRQAKWITLESTSPTAGIRIGSAGAKSPVTRADKLEALLRKLISAIDSLAAGGATIPTGVGPFVGLAKWQTASSDLKAQLKDLGSPGVVVD